MRHPVSPALLVGFLAASCATKPAARAEWLDAPEAIPEIEWRPVSPSRFYWIRDPESATAETLLESAELAEVSIPDALKLARAPELTPGVALRAFAVRGVCFGEQPTFATVRVSGDGRALHVHQGTARAELYFPGRSAELPERKRPLVVFLPGEPERVIVTAYADGDSALRAFRSADSKFFPVEQATEKD